VSVSGDFFQFRSGELSRVDIALTDSLTVADSWLVSEGHSRALDRHLKRFSNSIIDEKSQKQLPAFFAALVEATPVQGDWFPRIEYRQSQPEGERLFLRMRPAPERTETCTLWTSDKPDPREDFKTKGPDLSSCQALRRAANLHGADEAVMLSPTGEIADGALSSIVWWQEDILFAPDDTTNWLPSITRQLVLEIAGQAGYETKETSAAPVDLAGCEVWSLSALQGIRGVTSWGDISLGELRMQRPFSKRLALLNEELPSPDQVFELFGAG